MYPNDQSIFSVNSSRFEPEGTYTYIYNTALLNSSYDYSQFYCGAYNTMWIEVNFKYLLYLTHISYTPKLVSKPWQYATNFSISATTELNHSITIFKNEDPSYLNKSKPIVIPVRPGIYRSIRIDQFDLSINFVVIQYLDLFGAVCDPVSICNGNPLDILCSFRINYWKNSLFDICPFIIIFIS